MEIILVTNATLIRPNPISHFSEKISVKLMVEIPAVNKTPYFFSKPFILEMRLKRPRRLENQMRTEKRYYKSMVLATPPVTGENNLKSKIREEGTLSPPNSCVLSLATPDKKCRSDSTKHSS